jgi:probable HAF family extracellular repeat protein
MCRVRVYGRVFLIFAWLTLCRQAVLAQQFNAENQPDAKNQPFAPNRTPSTYTIREIDLVLPGYESGGASGINDRGQIVGTSIIIDRSTFRISKAHAVLWQEDQLIDLGTLSGTDDGCSAERTCSSMAAAINERGQIVGVSDIVSNSTSPQRHAVLWQDGIISDLGTLANGTLSEALALNNRGQVVGHSCTDPTPNQSDFYNCRERGFVWEAGYMMELGVLPSLACETYGCTTYASAINDRGEIVGASVLRVGYVTPEAVLWRNGQITDLGTPSGFARSWPTAINDKGEIAGVLATSSFGHAGLWERGSIFDLGTLSPTYDCNGPPCVSEVYAINNKGQAVGYSQLSAVNSYQISVRAFIWQHGQMTDLNDLIPADSGWALTSATAINNRGQIVGAGLHDGQQRTFLLTPVRRHQREP